MKKVILHVGMHKTASSSIQATLSRNRNKLESMGTHFPLFELNGMAIDNHSIPVFSLFSSNPENYHINIRFNVNVKQQNQEYKSKLIESLKLHDTVVVSGEDISMLTESELLELKPFLEQFGHVLDVHCILRSPYSLLCSLVQQNIKGGFPSLDHLHIVKVSNIVNKLNSCFDNVHYYSYELLCKSTNGLTVNFLNSLGIDSTDFIVVNDNAGLGNKTTRLLNYVNKRVPTFIDGVLNPHRVGSYSFDGSFNCDEDKFYLTQDELALVQNDLDAENATLEEIVGPDFMDNEYPETIEPRADLEFAEKVVNKSVNLPPALKRTIYDYLIENADFDTQHEFLNALFS